MEERVFEGQEILGCIEDMNQETFKEYNSIRVFANGVEIDISQLKIVVQNDPDQD